jgi:hypothetical protein
LPVPSLVVGASGPQALRASMALTFSPRLAASARLRCFSTGSFASASRALVERGADDVGKHRDLLGAGCLAGDGGAVLAGLLGGVVDEGIGRFKRGRVLRTLSSVSDCTADSRDGDQSFQVMVITDSRRW